jgi:phage gpG-like protein
MIRRRLVRLALVASIIAVPTLSAQAPAAVSDSGFTATPALLRVSLYRFADGMQQATLADMRMHLIPIWEAYKAAGIILDYSTMANVTASSKDDWQLGIVFTYANYAALDGLGAKQAPITLKHYGSAAARTAANEARNKLRILVSTNLVNVSRYTRK